MWSHYKDTINRFNTKKVMLCTVHFIAMFMQLLLLEIRDTLSFVSEIRLANLCISDHTCIEVLFSYLYFLNSLPKIFGVQYMTHSTVKLLNNKTVERWYSLKSLTMKCFCTRAYSLVVYSVLYFCPDLSVCSECLSQQEFWVYLLLEKKTHKALLKYLSLSTNSNICLPFKYTNSISSPCCIQFQKKIRPLLCHTNPCTLQFEN